MTELVPHFWLRKLLTTEGLAVKYNRVIEWYIRSLLCDKLMQPERNPPTFSQIRK